MAALHVFFLSLWYKINIENDFFQRVTQAYLKKEIPSSPNKSQTYDLPITSLDALPATGDSWELRPLN